MDSLVVWVQTNSWLYVGSIAGSLVSMLMARGLSFAGRMSSLLVGTLTGLFVGPFICELWFSSYDPQASRVPSFVCFATAGLAMALIPILVKRAKEWAAKYQLRVVAVEPTDE
jgi:uncharacterized membrane protein YeaQ/YmgE (transglycosylase-associated protein family)